MTEPTLSDEQKDRILSILADNEGNFNRASVVLGIAASSLKRRVEKWSEPQQEQEQESTSPTRRFFERARNPWSVTSFDTRTREACVEIRNPSTTTNFSYIVPDYRITG